MHAPPYMPLPHPREYPLPNTGCSAPITAGSITSYGAVFQTKKTSNSPTASRPPARDPVKRNSLTWLDGRWPFAVPALNLRRPRPPALEASLSEAEGQPSSCSAPRPRAYGRRPVARALERRRPLGERVAIPQSRENRVRGFSWVFFEAVVRKGNT